MYALPLTERSIGPIQKAASRLSDEEVVALVGLVLREPRAWAQADLADVCPAQRQDVAKRALRLLREALATV